MPRRVDGLSGKTRIPLRGLTQLLKHLPPAERDRLTSAFAESEDLLDFHSRGVAETQNKRRISGLIDTPIITAESSILGASVSWARLNDPRISFYEVQVSDTNVFTNPETFTVYETFFAIENVNTVKFIRVRGVRGSDGSTGNWSNTERVRPTVTAPRAFSSQFYQRYEGSRPDLVKPKTFGGPTFYTILSDTFYMNRQTGGVSLWGYVSNRLSQFADSNNLPWDRVRWKVNGLVRMDQYFPLWTDTFPNEADQPMTDPNGDPISFYLQGGYTASFGPYAVPLPFSLEGQGANDGSIATGPDAPGATFYWSNVKLAKKPTRWDRGQFTSATDTNAADESSVAGVTESATTNWLQLQDFGFRIPTDRNISGIQVDIKRRQTGGGGSEDIETDFGNATPNMPLTSDNTVGNKVVTSDDVFEEAGFGKLLDMTPTEAGRLRTGGGGGSPTELLLNVGENNELTAMGWFNPSVLVSDDSVTIHELINADGSADQANVNVNRIRVFIDNFDRLSAQIWDSTGNASKRSIGDIGTAPHLNLDETSHVSVVWRPISGLGTATDLNIRVNGALITQARSNVGPGIWAGTSSANTRIISIGSDTQGGTTGKYDGRAAQVALYNRGLTSVEIGDIVSASGAADLRTEDGSEDLSHYYLFFPGAGDMRDHQVFLVDETDAIRDDLTNQAVTDESWPIMSDFFYVNETENAHPIATAGGIPHDNAAAFGYQVYGGEADLWGAAQWTPAQVNDPKFGLAFRATNAPGNNPGTGFIDHIKMTVFTPRAGQRVVDVEVEAGAVNRFYIEREIFSAVFNGLEVGERLVDLPEDC